MLAAADKYVKSHPQLPSNYVTNRYAFSSEDVQQAFDTANRPTVGQIKVVLELEDTRKR
jgi:hypothetical protein